MSRLERIDQKFRSFDLSMRWNWSPGAEGSYCKSKTVIFAADWSRALNLPNALVKLSAIRNCILLSHPKHFHDFIAEMVDDLDGKAPC